MLRQLPFAWRFLLAFVLPVAAGGLVLHDESFIPDVILRVTASNASFACTNRWSVVVNGTSPGLPVHLKEGRTSWIRVYNDVEHANITMHWHGLSQSTAPFSDGTPRASQWPIPPLHFFDYEIHPNADEAGSYVYHSHVGFEAVSCAGPLIVEEASGQPPYQYDEERIFFVSELFAKTDNEIQAGLLARPLVWSGEAETILVNGQASAIENHTQPTNCCSPAVINVEPNKTYRVRFIGLTALSLVTLGFEDHNFSIIAADGSYTKQFNVSHIQVQSGQRFDALLRTKSAEQLRRAGRTSFYIQLETRYRPTTVLSYAILSYSDPNPSTALPAHPPLSLPEDIYDWLEYSLEPLHPNAFPSASEVTRRVHITSSQRNNGTLWTANNHTWHETAPRPPYLVSIYEHGRHAIPSYSAAIANGGRDPAFNAYAALVGEVLEIILENESDGLVGGYDIHPWHVHGRHVYDIGSGRGAYNATANELRLRGYHPVRRDTTILYKYTPGDALGKTPYTIGGWRAWRLRVVNAGVWMVHCHTLQHMIMGMQTVWIMGDAADILQKPRPELDGYLTYGGSAYGNVSHHPRVMHFFND